MAAPIFCSGLADLASRYQGFIVDQWGVLHDGGKTLRRRDRLPDPAARGRQARGAAQQLGPAHARSIATQLARIGIGAELYDEAVTSGEATWRALAERQATGVRQTSGGAACCGRAAASGGWSRVRRWRWWTTSQRPISCCSPAPRTMPGWRSSPPRWSRPRRGACRWSAPTPTWWSCSRAAVSAWRPGARCGALRRPRRARRLCRQAAPAGLPAVPRGARPPAARGGADDRRFGRPRHRRRRRDGPRDRADHGRHPRAPVRPRTRPERERRGARAPAGRLRRIARLGAAALPLVRRSDPRAAGGGPAAGGRCPRTPRPATTKLGTPKTPAARASATVVASAAAVSGWSSVAAKPAASSPTSLAISPTAASSRGETPSRTSPANSRRLKRSSAPRRPAAVAASARRRPSKRTSRGSR